MATFIYPQIDISDQKLTDIEQNTADTVSELQNVIAALSDDSQTTQIVDSAGNPVNITANALDVNITGSALPAGAATEATLLDVKAAVESLDNAISGNELQVDVVSSALPTGAATEAKQDTGNTSLASIDGKLPASLGSKSKANSLSVTLASDQEPVSVRDKSLIDTGNSSTTPLAGAGVFTGTAINISDYSTISVLVASDVASATNGFSFQFSNDGTNWDHKHEFSFSSGSLSYNMSAEATYFRLVYTNGASAQGHFRLQTVLHTAYIPPSEYTLGQSVSDSTLASVSKSVIYGKSTAGGGSYVATKVNPSGALTVEADVVASALPTGAATEATLASIESDTSTLASTVLGGKVVVDGSSVTQPISATSLPLPTGAATEAKQDTGNSSLSSIDSKIPASLTVSSTRLLVDGSGVTQPISASSLPLPSGAATETTLDAIKTSVELLDNAISGSEMQVDVVSSALPTGAATSAAQTDGSQKSQIVSSGGTSVSLTGTYLDVNLASGSVTATNSANGATGAAVPTDATMVGGSDSGTLRAIKVSATGVVSVDGSAVTQPVSASSLPLPTGAATETTLATLATESTLSTLNSKVPSNLTVTSTRLLVDGSGVTQPVSASSLPLPTGAATEATLSALNTKVTTTANGIKVDGSAVTQPVSGTVTANAGTGSFTVAQSTATNLKAQAEVYQGGTAVGAASPLQVSLANTAANSTAVKVDGSAVTQPVAQAGRTKANTPTFNDYSSTNVTTSAYVQLVASTSSACTAVEIYNQCASSIYLATGATASEVNQLIIPPGGNGLVPIAIAASTRIAVKAVDVSATSGSLIINYWT